MVYEWRDGSRIKGDAQEIGNCIEKLTVRRGGHLKPNDIVTAARRKSSPLHNLFEWDESAAATEYRRWQARRVLNSLRVVVEVTPGASPEPTVAYYSVQTEEAERAYVPAQTVVRHEDMRTYALREALIMLAAARKRYSHLSELSSVFDEVGNVLEAVGPQVGL